MALIKVKTKNQLDVGKKPRVYFTCHPEDFEKYFNKICDDIFKTHDCAIYYTEDMSEVIAEDEKEIDLGRNNLFVIPVTYKLLSTPNRAIDDDLPYAMEKHIPVLPVVMEKGLDALYSKPDKFGELQYINPYSTDTTEISYEEKLKKHLESKLISAEMADRIRAAFDAYIFLSYRKKDRKYANQLIHFIHSNPECRNIAIWFDEFLTPGESFKESIDKILHDSKLFTLLVTPNILEEPNFVMGEEYPAAQKSGINILPAEMVETDKVALKEKYVGLPECINPEDAEFYTRILDSLTKIAKEENDIPEHNFLIGLAYLEGIDVEVNREIALELITSAAEAGLPEAMEKLRDMYANGSGVQLDYSKALIWAERLADYLSDAYGAENINTLVAFNNLAYSYGVLNNPKKALEINEKVYKTLCDTIGESHQDTLVCLSNIAYNYSMLENFEKSLELNAKVYDISLQTLGEEHPDTLLALNNFAGAHTLSEKFDEASEMFEKLYSLSFKVFGEEHPYTLTALNNLAGVYGKLGLNEKALELNEKAYTLRCKVLGEEHPDTICSLSNIADNYYSLNDNQKAVEIFEKKYAVKCKLLGEEHPDVVDDLDVLIKMYAKAHDFEKAEKLNQKLIDIRIKSVGEFKAAIAATANKIIIDSNRPNIKDTEIEKAEKKYVQMCKQYGEEHPDAISALLCMAHTYKNYREYENALELYQKVYIIQVKVFGEADYYSLLILGCISEVYFSLGDYKGALEVAEKRYNICFDKFGKYHSSTRICLKELAKIHGALGNHEKEAEIKKSMNAHL